MWFYPCSCICDCLKMPKKSQINEYSDQNPNELPTNVLIDHKKQARVFVHHNAQAVENWWANCRLTDLLGGRTHPLHTAGDPAVETTALACTPSAGMDASGADIIELGVLPALLRSNPWWPSHPGRHVSNQANSWTLHRLPLHSHCCRAFSVCPTLWSRSWQIKGSSCMTMG